MDNQQEQPSGVSDFVHKRHHDDQKLRAEKTTSRVNQDEELLIDMADERHPKAEAIEQHRMTRSNEDSSLENSGSFSANQRAQQQQESSSYFGMVINMIRGLILPPREIQYALRERDEASLAKLQQQNQELYQAYVSYRSRAKDLEALLHNSVSMDYLGSYTQGAEESFERRMAERAVQHRDEMKSVQEAAEVEVAAANREVRTVQDNKELAVKSCRKYEQQIEKLEVAIRNMQTAQLRSVESTQWAALPTAEIEHRLKVLHSGIRQWAEDNTKDATIDYVLKPDQFKLTVRRLIHRGCIRSGTQLGECLLRNKAMRKPGKASQVLLTAAVSFDIFSKIIGNPFFAFVGDNDVDILCESLGEDLQVLLDLIRTGNEAGAEALRCQVLRLLDSPNEEGVSSSMGKVQEEVKACRSKAQEGIVNAIVSEYMGELSAEQLAHARNGLAALVEDACVLSWALWTRKARIEVHDWTSLKKFQTGDMHYKATSGIFETHPLHKRDLEDSPKALDGISIALLCTPPIFVAGNAEGEGYHKRTVLKKAIVWMG